jgi:hypothetical protein
MYSLNATFGYVVEVVYTHMQVEISELLFHYQKGVVTHKVCCATHCAYAYIWTWRAPILLASLPIPHPSLIPLTARNGPTAGARRALAPYCQEPNNKNKWRWRRKKNSAPPSYMKSIWEHPSPIYVVN